MKILSLCTSAGLWDKAWVQRGHEVIPGCEIMLHKRRMYKAFVGGPDHLCHDIADLSDLVRGSHFDGIIGGIPCQSRSRLKAMRSPKFGDLLTSTLEVLRNCTWDWALFENVEPLDIAGFKSIKLNAVNYGVPPQSRARAFTFSPNLIPPPVLIPGTIDALRAYPAVAGKLYGPKRGAWLQGWDTFADLDFPCHQLQEALADGVPRSLAEAWIDQIERMVVLRGAA